MQILIADQFPPQHVERLRALGHEVTFDPSLDGDALPEVVGDHDVIVVRSTSVSAQTIQAAGALTLIVRAGAGVNTIDTDAAADRGVVVANTPGKNAIAVAELTLGLIMAIDRNIPDNVADLKAGVWNKKKWSQAEGLAGRRLGIVGFGSIGREVAKRAAGFDLEILVAERPGRSGEAARLIDELGIKVVADVDALVGEADIVTFHVPAAPQTAGMINADLLKRMRRGAVLINTSRGDIVDEEALLAAIGEKDLRVGTDVYGDEPASSAGEFSSTLAQHPNVYGTHHIGASTEQAQRAIADEVVHVIEGFARGSVANAVNVATGAVGSAVVTVRHLNRVGVLAQVLQILRSAQLNVEQMQNMVFVGGHAARATIHLSAVPAPETLELITGVDNVISVSAGAVAGTRPLVRAFDGYLPRPDIASRIVAPPLSSITVDRYDQLVSDNPTSILWVLRSAIDTASGVGDGERRDATAAAQLARFVEDRVLIRQPEAAFYVYRTDAGGTSHVGVVAEVGVHGLDDGSIRRHEDTRRETEDLVLDHLRDVRAHTDPVAMMHRSDDALAALLEDVMEGQAPVLDFSAGDGPRQRLWVVADSGQLDAIGARLASLERLYITDGHHRCAAAHRLAAEERASNAQHLGTEAYNYLPAVLFAEDQVLVEGYHRGVRDLGELGAGEFLSKMGKVFDLEEIAVPWAEEARPRQSGVVAMFVDDKWYRFKLPVDPDGDVFSRLDTVLLQQHVLGPLLGVEAPRSDSRLLYVPGPAGLGEFARAGVAVGLALHPPSTRDVMAVADTGLVMPPKSTWFEPKVRAGLVVRPI